MLFPADSGRYEVMVVKNMFLLYVAIITLWHGTAHAALGFRNFARTVTLSPRADGSYSLEDGSRVRVANRIVVKAKAGVDKERLAAVDSRVTGVTELYRLENGCYYAVEFSGKGALEEMLNRFAASPLVIAAQPDLLQVHDKSDKAASTRQTFDYLKTLDIPRMWENSRGRGVRIAIIDDGIDLKHEDLLGVTLAFGYDLETRTLDPSPKADRDTHGTEVAGIIFARHNGKGIDGIAPEAELVALRHTDTWTSLTLLEFNLARLAGADIVNCSWTFRFMPEPVADVVVDLTVKGRRGKGAAVVFAAGNAGRMSAEAALPGVIAVGSLDRNGLRAGFSNYGKGVTVYTYGSDILTTGRGGRYVSFSGTSASAAIVSGVIALYLSRNPELALNDINGMMSATFLQKELYDRE